MAIGLGSEDCTPRIATRASRKPHATGLKTPTVRRPSIDGCALSAPSKRVSWIVNRPERHHDRRYRTVPREHDCRHDGYRPRGSSQTDCRKLGGGHMTNDQSNRRENSTALVGSPIAVLMLPTASSRIRGFNGDWPRQRGLHTSNRDPGFSQTSRAERFPTINLRVIEQLPRGIRWHVRLSLHSCMRS
jgi:hypothetical protein